MCGRFASQFEDSIIIDVFGIERVFPLAPPSWNVAPTQAITLVREELAPTQPVRLAQVARWGLVPSWAKDTKGAARLINARSETVTEKPSFRVAARRRRALVPASGYFEWQGAADGSKTPYYLHPEPDGQVLALAALYEWWDKANSPAEPLLSATIITRTATDQLGHIHDRMPLVVPANMWAEWLDPEPGSASQVQSMIAAMPAPQLTPRQVSRAVGSVKNNHPGLLEPVG